DAQCKAACRRAENHSGSRGGNSRRRVCREARVSVPELPLPARLSGPRRGFGGPHLNKTSAGPVTVAERQEKAAKARGQRRLCFKFGPASYLLFLGAFLSSFLAFFFIQWLLCDFNSHADCVVPVPGLAAPATCSSARYTV